MCYKCDVCRRVVPPSVSRLQHQVLRRDGTIAREIPVCKECHGGLKRGMALNLLRAHRNPEEFPPPLLLEVKTKGRKLV